MKFPRLLVCCFGGQRERWACSAYSSWTQFRSVQDSFSALPSPFDYPIEQIPIESYSVHLHIFLKDTHIHLQNLSENVLALCQSPWDLSVKSVLCMTLYRSSWASNPWPCINILCSLSQALPCWDNTVRLTAACLYERVTYWALDQPCPVLSCEISFGFLCVCCQGSLFQSFGWLARVHATENHLCVSMQLGAYCMHYLVWYQCCWS